MSMQPREPINFGASPPTAENVVNNSKFGVELSAGRSGVNGQVQLGPLRDSAAIRIVGNNVKTQRVKEVVFNNDWAVRRKQDSSMGTSGVYQSDTQTATFAGVTASSSNSAAVNRHGVEFKGQMEMGSHDIYKYNLSTDGCCGGCWSCLSSVGKGLKWGAGKFGEGLYWGVFKALPWVLEKGLKLAVAVLSVLK